MSLLLPTAHRRLVMIPGELAPAAERLLRQGIAEVMACQRELAGQCEFILRYTDWRISDGPHGGRLLEIQHEPAQPLNVAAVIRPLAPTATQGLSLPEVVDVARAVLEALAAAHRSGARGRLHGAVGPGTLLRARDDPQRWMLTDFLLAAVLRPFMGGLRQVALSTPDPERGFEGCSGLWETLDPNETERDDRILPYLPPEWHMAGLTGADPEITTAYDAYGTGIILFLLAAQTHPYLTQGADLHRFSDTADYKHGEYAQRPPPFRACEKVERTPADECSRALWGYMLGARHTPGVVDQLLAHDSDRRVSIVDAHAKLQPLLPPRDRFSPLRRSLDSVRQALQAGDLERVERLLAEFQGDRRWTQAPTSLREERTSLEAQVRAAVIDARVRPLLTELGSLTSIAPDRADADSVDRAEALVAQINAMPEATSEHRRRAAAAADWCHAARGEIEARPILIELQTLLRTHAESADQKAVAHAKSLIERLRRIRHAPTQATATLSKAEAWLASAAAALAVRPLAEELGSLTKTPAADAASSSDVQRVRALIDRILATPHAPASAISTANAARTWCDQATGAAEVRPLVEQLRPAERVNLGQAELPCRFIGQNLSVSRAAVARHRSRAAQPLMPMWRAARSGCSGRAASDPSGGGAAPAARSGTARTSPARPPS